MSHVIAFYDSSTDEVKVEWNLDIPKHSPPVDKAVEQTSFISNFFDCTLFDSKLWPFSNYAIQISEVAGETGDPGGGEADTYEFELTSIPDIVP